MLIDDKGRLFGKLNLIDLGVLLLVVILAAGFLYKDSAAGADSEGRTVVLKVVSPAQYPGVGEQIKVGDIVVASGAPTGARITSVEVKPANWVAANAQGQMILSQNPFRKDVYVTIEGKTTQVTPGEITFAGQKVRAGKKDFVVKTQTIEMADSTIISVEVK